ncbi:3-hydroxyisobutyrate dehydrogenase [Parendozoicomonas haliclonae]|uniref:3-hydroxyisobutyrate dehydrogenase n=1 Tax=Parendozoicomonas haliclonae TaxID=1960125 RepID=A0A1X7ALF4_9GAMM|nr:3-hydroxyisobutyrate dehydrogenase [Parendozoicomonas haliclonae]SMA47977.1 3-hydroxyisobutyrate dehydrogenase [Parendozoicomonas haliclonae]
MNIAFFGLGNMGGPMAANLVKAGYAVKGFDLSPESLVAFREIGGEVAETPAEAASGADVVISMLPNGQIVRDLYAGEGNLFGQLMPNTLVIDCSTIDLSTARDMAEKAHMEGLVFLDAPVSGGTAGAAAGTLTFMVGGEDAAFERAKPVLAHMGKNIFHAGKVGCGQLVKMCNNMLLAIHMAGTAEALALGQANGMDPKVLSDIMLQSSGANWSLEKYNPVPGVMDGVPASKDYQGGFMVDLMLKDLGLAAEIASQSQQDTPMGDLARSLFGQHAEAGNGSLDFSSIFRAYQK